MRTRHLEWVMSLAVLLGCLTSMLDLAMAASTAAKGMISGAGKREFSKDLTVVAPRLWSVESPALYYVQTIVSSGGRMLDDVTTPFGIRQIRWDTNRGLFVNDRSTVLKGVCIHHDLGCLGAAFNQRAMQRRLAVLRDMGCNALRTSHNPPASGLLDLCDRMGFLVIDEVFDKWGGRNYPTFAQTWQQDLQAMLLRDRNHPSVILWSVGNEVGQQDSV